MASKFDPDAYLKEGSSSGGFDPDAYLGVAPQEQPNPSIQDTLMASLKQTATPFTAFAQMNRDLKNDPAKVARSPIIQAGLPIAGGALGGPLGAIAGEAARQTLGTAIAPETVPQTALGRAAAMASAGVAQEPKVLSAIPGVSQVGGMVKNLASKVGKNAAKFGEAVTGAKAKDLEQAAKQGLFTYGAPSMEEAQNIFGQAMAKEGIPSKPPLNQIIDPQLSTARKVAMKVGGKLADGLDITTEEALRGRQAMDRIYNATPLIDRSTRGHIADLRSALDDILSNKSGALANASKIYRQSIVKSNILNPFRITKQGQMSAVAPMVAALAASAGLGSGHKGESGLGALGYLAASSPAVAGLAATSGGSAARAFGALASRPEVRQALLQILQRIQNKPTQEAPQ